MHSHRQKKRSATVNKLTGIYLISRMKGYKAYKHYIVSVEHFTSSASTKRACFVLSSWFSFLWRYKGKPYVYVVL